MPDEKADAAYLWDMLDAARAILDFTRGADLAAYRREPMMRRAVERELEIVGEAAAHVSESFRAAHQEIPWRSVVGLRNVLIHAYGQVDDARVWKVVVDHLPTMIRDLTPLLPPEPGS
ncbi:MAG: DUF86 domain-containing protein [Planctomycetes bacterium]|nr:DUF86 domain-containing protein [Planctomycetota bacterium]